MEIYRGIENFVKSDKQVVTIGTFDGVHLGHQKVLTELKRVAKSMKSKTLVITFWPHPRIVLGKRGEKPGLLSSLDDKILMFQQMSVDGLLILDFNIEFASQNPETFIKKLLVETIGVKAVVIGYDHRFGKDRSGSFDYLHEHSLVYNYSVLEVSAFQFEEVSVSSTKIREALLSGDVLKANHFLGYEYFFHGMVVSGYKIGSKLGFPTANIQLDDFDKLLPKDGVYVVKSEINSNDYFGMMNIGENPTIPEKGRSIEVHFLGFNKDIYDKSIRINILNRLRDEIKFGTVEELKLQLERDLTQTKIFVADQKNK